MIYTRKREREERERHTKNDSLVSKQRLSLWLYTSDAWMDVYVYAPHPVVVLRRMIAVKSMPTNAASTLQTPSRPVLQHPHPQSSSLKNATSRRQKQRMENTIRRGRMNPRMRETEKNHQPKKQTNYWSGVPERYVPMEMSDCVCGWRNAGAELIVLPNSTPQTKKLILCPTLRCFHFNSL